jgi:hypothetical protein
LPGDLARLLLPVTGGIENEWNARQLRVGAQRGDQRGAVHSRHDDVDDHQVGPSPARGVQRLHAVRRFDDFMTVVTQQSAEEIAVQRVIIGNENEWHCSTLPDSRKRNLVAESGKYLISI